MGSHDCPKAPKSSRGVGPKGSTETHPTASAASVRAVPREAKQSSRGGGESRPAVSRQLGDERLSKNPRVAGVAPGPREAKRGRPRIGEERSKPWLEAKPPMSRSTWYRRQAEEKEGKR